MAANLRGIIIVELDPLTKLSGSAHVLHALFIRPVKQKKMSVKL